MDDKQKPGQLDDILRRRNELDDILEDRFKRPTTIVFTDIVGATNYFSTRGDLEGQLMIQRHNDLLIPLITKHSGNLINIVGDGLLASFEMSSTAVACAVDMQESLLRLNAARAERDQTQVRIGINTGTGYVESGNVYGVVINVAERVKALADGDQILISESTYQSLQPGKDPLCAFLDKVRVKGIEEEIKVYQVVWRNGERGQSLRGGARRDLGANKADLVLQAARENGQIKVCAFERGDGSERTLRPYENVAVSWDQVETTRREIITLLNRANDRAKVTSDILASLKISGRLLFDLLIPSNTRATLETTTVRNLTLYVDDKLVHIPWELLFDGKQFLCRRFAMGRIVSARQAPTSAASRASKAPYKVLILGDPRGDLDGSYREGLEIKDFLDEKRDMFHVDFKSDPVDVAFVKKNLCDYDIVHYAGHAEYNSGNPSENGWLLKDARLKASEISAMGGSQPMPSLVFSNARQSGHSGEWQLGEDCQQQIYGLANAYLLAGVQHYIGTFWEILDEPSGYFAKRFYGFVAQGMPVGEAVRRARLELIDAYGEETIVWATYMLYGDPTFEFSKDRRETVVEPVARQPVCVEAPQAVHSEEIAQPQPAVQKSYTHFVYPLLGLLLLALAYGGHSFFFKTNTKMPERQPEAQQTQVGASAPAAREPIIPAQQEKSPPGSVPVAKVNNRPDVAKPKELTSTAKPQQAAPAPKPDEVAVAKGPAPAPVAAPLTLKMNIIGQRKERDGSYSEILVSEGRVLRSRDNFQIHLEASRSAYVYVLLYDSQGKASQVFPDPKANQEGLLSSGSKLVIPSRDRWFWLDESTGTETIYVLAAENPMSDVRGLLAKMEGGDEAGQKSAWQEIKQRIAVMQRGVGAISKGQAVTYTLSDGKKIQKLTDVVTAKGSVVRIVSFQHK